MLQWDDFTQDCVKILETSEERVPSDLILCQWAHLQSLVDQVVFQIQEGPGVGQHCPKNKAEDIEQRLRWLYNQFCDTKPPRK